MMAERRLQIFHAVAEHLSFTRAAEALFMTQPAVTLQIKHLEAEYGTRLFERRPGGISLTPAGELMHSYAGDILKLSREMETRLGEMTGEMRGLLRVGASASVVDFLPRALSEFNALYPQVRIRLSVANSENIENRVGAHSLDVGLLGAPAKLAGLVCRECGGDELVVICTPDYPLAALPEVTPKLLVDYEFISQEPGSGGRAMIEAWFSAQQVEPRLLKTQMELGSLEALKGMVATGLGFAIVPRVVVDKEVRLGELVAVALQPALRSTLRLIYPQDRFQSRLVATFVEFAAGMLREAAI